MSDTYRYARLFFEALAEKAPLNETFTALHKYISGIGFPTIYFGVRKDPFHPAPASLENRWIFTRDHDGWWEEYVANRYHLVDPFYDIARQVEGVFIFQPPNNLTGQRKRFVEYATKRNKMNGFAFSFSALSGRVSGFSATGGDAKPTPIQIAETKSAFLAWNEYITAHLAQIGADDLGLSDLELARIHLLLAGHSARSIAEIQNASEHAINHSFLRIRKKLSVDSNAQLAVRVIQIGLFDTGLRQM